MEIQVLRRAFAILERAAEEPDAVWSVGELATASGLKTTTCFHIVNTLTALGYLECLGKRKGYRLGPAANRFSRTPVYRRRLTEAAEPLLRRFAAELGETVLLAVSRAADRYILVQAEGQNTLQVNPRLILQDLYNTATGRLLLAHYGDDERAEAVAVLGLPAWDGMGEAELAVALNGIRPLDALIADNNPEVAQIALPVWEKGRVAAALGCFVPHYRFTGEHRTRVLTELKRIAAELSRGIAAESSFTA